MNLNALKNKFPLSDPYRMFFPLGLLGGLVGLSLWLLFQARLINFYPRYHHGHLMFLVMLWSFVCGFLMTAIPKMTGSFPTQKFEAWITGTLIVVQASVVLLHQTKVSAFVFLFQILFLMYFVLRRFLVKKIIPFEGFYFVPFAFAQALTGTLYFIFSEAPNTTLFYNFVGKAFIMNLIVGVGSRLVPVISKAPNALMPDVQTKAQNQIMVLSLAVGLNLGMLLESLSYLPTLGVGLQFLCVVIISIKFFKIFKKPLMFSVLGVGLKSGILFLWTYYILKLVGDYSVAAEHFLYIGVFLLITLMVASRVMLAHGGHSMTYEMNSKRLGLVVGLFWIGVVLRFLAGAQFDSVLLTVSVLSVMTAILLWGQKFYKILKKV